MSGSAMRENVAQLLDAPGEQKEITRTFVASDLALSECRVPEGEVVRFDAVLDSLGDSVAVSGTVAFIWTGECRRCLGDVSGEVEAPVREVYSRLGDEDTFELEGDEIDLEPLIREAVLLELPMGPLCRDDCRGPVPDRYPAEPVADPDPDADAPRDPRWAALDDLDLS